MRPRNFALLLIAACVGWNCGENIALTPEPLETSMTAVMRSQGPLPHDADLSEPPSTSLNFSSEWRLFVDGPLYHGGEVRISVDPCRFPNCGTSGDVAVWIRGDDGGLTEVVLDQGTPGFYVWGSGRLPAHGESIEIWLRSSRSDGCEEWDSRFGENYKFDLMPWRPVRLHFSSDWTISVLSKDGLLRGGDTLVIDYDFSRLPNCRIVYRGFPSWNILAHLRYDGGDVITQNLVGYSDPQTIVRRLGVVPAPIDVRHLEMWFENSQYPPTCREWDSDFGHNYHFQIVPGG